MNKLLFVLLSIFVASCAHSPNQGEKVVHFPYASDLLKTIQGTAARAPASIESAKPEEEGKSTRRVYFTSLYHQYLTLGEHLNKEGEITSCPQFHHDKLQTETYVVPKLSMAPRTSIQETGKDFFPELAFNKNFSLRDYHAVIKSEIETLCEEGLSDNFYKFDNLVTHYANKKSFHRNTKAMESVLKIPVFANFYLLKMLRPQETVSFSHPHEKQFIQMTQTQWFDLYVTEASRLRSNFMKNKMVQR